MNKAYFEALVLDLIRKRVCPAELTDAELQALRASLCSLGHSLRLMKTADLRALLEER